MQNRSAVSPNVLLATSAFLGLLVFGTPIVAKPTGIEAAYINRLSLSLVDARCALLAPRTAGTLRASVSQTRSALKAAGWTENDIAASAAIAVRVANKYACDDPTVVAEIASAKAGFEALAREPVHFFLDPNAPDKNTGWVARRLPVDGWWLQRPARTDTLPTGRFGLLADGAHQLHFAFGVGDQDAASIGSVRLIYRDPVRAPDYVASNALSGDAITWRGAARVALARDTMIRPADLSGQKRKPKIHAWLFSAACFDEINRLDPREAAILEITAPARLGQKVTRIRVTIGEIAGARAWLAAGEPPITR